MVERSQNGWFAPFLRRAKSVSDYQPNCRLSATNSLVNIHRFGTLLFFQYQDSFINNFDEGYVVVSECNQHNLGVLEVESEGHLIKKGSRQIVMPI